MKFLVQLEIFSLAVNFQLVKSQLPYYKDGTIYIRDGNETVTLEQPKHIDNNEQNLPKDEKQNQHKPGQSESSGALGPTDHYTFVAIIEIMFNDGSRKHCSGAIIHDNVVITAAHCFENQRLKTSQPELIGSFVIIGTKQMYESGYEQYLLIERVLIHPDYKGWNADLALVYTFAGMMSDKPGDIIPMAEENSYTNIYTNVTVFNWNRIKKNVPLDDSVCSGSSEDKDIYMKKEVSPPILSNEDWSKELTEETTLIMEDYTIINTVKCKSLVQNLKPDIYHIENVNKTICYLTKHPNKVQANSGAPAVNRKHLVAIAAGDFNNESEHIIVATKLNCYCTWISENLPDSGEKLQCCKNCCHEMRFKRRQEVYFKYKK